SNSDHDLSSPLYATVVGLLMKGLAENEKKPKIKEVFRAENEGDDPEKKIETPKKTVFEKWGEKLRDFLDNAE
ncbi:MAG: cell division protein FtsA, partial [Flavobacteriaceae bacterium]|nr:cell division protein FtsA [Flavobacteriaceae bacterium]